MNAVAHRYGNSVALESVTLSVPGACMVGLIGPDGVGKSTLLSLLAGARKRHRFAGAGCQSQRFVE